MEITHARQSHRKCCVYLIGQHQNRKSAPRHLWRANPFSILPKDLVVHGRAPHVPVAKGQTALRSARPYDDFGYGRISPSSPTRPFSRSTRCEHISFRSAPARAFNSWIMDDKNCLRYLTPSSESRRNRNSTHFLCQTPSSAPDSRAELQESRARRNISLVATHGPANTQSH